MSTLSFTPRKLEPMRPKGYQDSEPFSAHHMSELAQRHAALVRRAMSNSMTYHWPFPGSPTPAFIKEAPVARVSASNTWTNFSFEVGTAAAPEKEHDCGLPWLVGINAGRVEARLVVLSEHSFSFQARIISETLIDTVDTVNGDPSSLHRCFNRDVPFFYSVRSTRTAESWPIGPSLTEVSCAVAPALPASRVVAIQPQLFVPSTDSTGMGVDISEHEFWLISCSVYDVADESENG